MVKFKYLYCFTLFAFVELTASLIPNVTKINNVNNDLRRSGKKKKKERSTSSSDQGKVGSSLADDKESLDLSTHELTSEGSDASKKPVSSAERQGWRKWHRKCPTCPEDMVKKWRDPTIKWICGGYQRARRSFKSDCMMHYRNCQDGTMFVKLHEHRCTDAIGKDQPKGINFFYDYKVVLTDDSSERSSSEGESDDESSDL